MSTMLYIGEFSYFQTLKVEKILIIFLCRQKFVFSTFVRFKLCQPWTEVAKKNIIKSHSYMMQIYYNYSNDTNLSHNC
jgi:hypothetical protein